MISYRVTTSIIAIIISVVILYLLRRDHLHPRYAPWWFMVVVGIILFGMMPSIINIIGHVLGAHYPPIIIIVISICLILLKMLRMDIDRSQRERQLRRLAQRMAVLEGEMNKKSKLIHEKQQKDK